MQSNTNISFDASVHGLGAVTLQQQQNAQWRPVAYALKAMSETK